MKDSAKTSLPPATPGFGKEHVEAQRPDFVLIKKNVDNVGQRVPLPGPLAELYLAGLVDIDDDDSLIHAAGHREANPNVVQVIFHAVDDFEARTAGNVHGEDDQCEQADRDASQLAGRTRGQWHGVNLHESVNFSAVNGLGRPNDSKSV